MKIDVLLSPHNVDELYFTAKTTVIIDVLRATTTIATALEAGAKEIIPVGSLDFAMKISGAAAGGQTLLCGERNINMIEGFSHGNSPLEYKDENIEGKSIIFFTTNGSKAIVKAKFSENLFLASFNNLDAIVNYLIKLDKDFNIVCSASEGVFCVEDTVCAGKIVSEVLNKKPKCEITDASKAAIVLYEFFGKDLLKMLSECEHGKKLAAKGFSEDIEYCAKLNSNNIIPYFENGSIKAIKEEEK